MTNVTLSSLCNLKDGELLEKTMNVAQREQRTEAELCAHLAVVDERKLYLAEGFNSMHAFCTTVLHFSEGAAYQRIRAARLVRENRAENLTLRCQAHNLYAADQVFGVEFMRRAKGRTLPGKSWHEESAQ